MNKNSSNNIFKIGKTAKGTFELDHNQIQNTARRATHKNREFADHDFEKKYEPSCRIYFYDTFARARADHLQHRACISGVTGWTTK